MITYLAADGLENETLKVLETRRSCRNFKPDMVKKEEFESEIGKDILKKLGISDEYEGIGHCALGYAAEPSKVAAPRKENYVYYI